MPGRSRLAVAQATDVADWLPHDLLLKLDRCLMAHGVEGRTPFLDPEVALAGFRLPDGLKVRNGRGKYLLRRWLEGAMPAGAAVCAEAGLHGSGRRLDRGAGRAARPAGRRAAGRRRDRRAQPGDRAIPPGGGQARRRRPLGRCCSTRYGTGRTCWASRPAGGRFRDA